VKLLQDIAAQFTEAKEKLNLQRTYRDRC